MPWASDIRSIIITIITIINIFNIVNIVTIINIIILLFLLSKLLMYKQYINNNDNLYFCECLKKCAENDYNYNYYYFVI